MVTYPSIQDQLPLIDAASLKSLWEQQAVRLIDVREPSEYAGEHIPGAISKPLSSLNPEEFRQESEPFVIYCQQGNRSATAAKKLGLAGLNPVPQLAGGLNHWKQLGYPTKVNRNAPISIMRQVQIVTGSLVLFGTVLGVWISPGFLFLSGFVGAGLLFAGISNTCLLAQLLAKLPYNQQF